MKAKLFAALLLGVMVLPAASASHDTRGQCAGTEGPIWNDEVCIPMPVHVDGQDCELGWEAEVYVGPGTDPFVATSCVIDDGEDMDVCAGGFIQAPTPFLDQAEFSGEDALRVCLEE